MAESITQPITHSIVEDITQDTTPPISSTYFFNLSLKTWILQTLNEGKEQGQTQ